MYQVTAIYEGTEVGYGESELYEDAALECSESVPGIYPDDEVQMVCTHGVLRVSIPLNLYRSVSAVNELQAMAQAQGEYA